MSSKPQKSNKASGKGAEKPAKPAKPAGDAPSQAGFSKAELAEFRTLLNVRKRILQGDVKGLESEAMKKGADGGDLSTIPMHLADLGTDSFEQDMSLGLMESESDELQQIEEAFERIVDGTFGLCETCKKKVPKERLKAIPYSRLCVGCKMKEEGV